MTAVTYLQRFLAASTVLVAVAASDAYWAYTIDADWANLDPHYAACGYRKQSPVNIVTADVKYKDSLSAFTMSGYNKVQGLLTLNNNGHSAQVDTTGATWTVTGGSLTDTYKLLQFHFHWGQNAVTGSEHNIDSKRYPLEMHMVHMSTKYDNFSEALEHKKSLTFLTTMFEEVPDDNPALTELVDNLINVHYVGDTTVLPVFKLRSLMPSNLADYYTYEGSLTTPPCSEVVVWNIFHQPVKISRKQLYKFRALRNHALGQPTQGRNGELVDNFRQVNKLNGRTVFSSVNIHCDTTGSGCIRSCKNKRNGDYQSCDGCHMYTTCIYGRIYANRPCPATLVWNNRRKRCDWKSPTCDCVRN